MGFEQSSLQSSSYEKTREPEGFPDLDKALQQAEKQVFQYAIKPADFARPYGPYEQESIQRDLAYADRMEKTFRDQHLAQAQPGARARWEMLQKLGKVFEAIVLFNGDRNEWFGSNAQVIIPSRYDDIVNGVDGIVEFEGDKNFFSHLALGIDLTTSTDIHRKFQRIYQDIDKGELTKVRYFQSERQHIKGEKRNIPRVIVGADKQTLHDLLVLWNAGKNSGFAKHPMQIQMLDEIACQLKAFASYADTKKQPALAQIYRTDLEIIENILTQKQEEFGETALQSMRAIASEDTVYQSIKRVSSIA